MQLVLHTGAHYTEHERLIKTILRNKDRLRKRGIAVPGPGSYRKLVRDTLNAMPKAPAAPGAREVLLDVMLDEAEADRLILSDANFFRTAGTAVQKGVLYPDAPSRLGHMAQLFPEDDIEVFLGIRNPAALLPVFYEHAVNKAQSGFWGTRNATNILWSETIARIRDAIPNVPITVWCYEDMPLIWGQIIREMAGIDPNEKINGAFDLLASIMSKEGMQRFRAYLDAHPDMSEIQKRRVISAFLDKFALDDAIEEELDMDGWTDDFVEELTELYDEDIEVISRIPGVSIIEP